MRPRKVFCIGLGGIGVSAIAKYYAAQGIPVTGTDPAPSPVIDDAVRRGARFIQNELPENVQSDIDLVVYTDACRPDHPEILAAKKLGLRCLNFSQALGEIMQSYPQRIAIAGTNGKSTTAALTGLLLTDAGLDPSVFVGSRVPDFQGNLRLGSKQIFVAEADEWRNHFFALSPNILAVLNVELDHPDFFQSLEQLSASFQHVISRLPAGGHLVLNLDDRITRQWATHPYAIGIGRDSGDLRYHVLRTGPEYQEFSAEWKGRDLGTFRLPVPGVFNIVNASMAMAVALVAGARPASFRSTLANYRGIWRRFEIIRNQPYTVVNDYAHHPTAIRETILAARAFYPGRPIRAVFQPHLHRRLTTLFRDFVAALKLADSVGIVEVYQVLGRTEVQGMKSGRELATSLQAQNKPTSYWPEVASATSALKSLARPNDVILLLSAGDLWTAATDI